MSLVILIITIMLTALTMYHSDAERLLWNAIVGLHIYNMCFLPMVLLLTVKKGPRTHPAPPSGLHFHEDPEQVDENDTKVEDLKPIRSISVLLPHKAVKWTPSIDSVSTI